jgi:D-serine deaminase-like pyridoxal phosphate-dependent protein
MMNEETRRDRRRTRKEPISAFRAAQRALNQSLRLAAANQFTKAARAAQLAERHAKLAAQLIDLDASLKRIGVARHRALMAIASAAEAKLARHTPRPAIADQSPTCSSRDPNVRALFTKAMEKERAE